MRKVGLAAGAALLALAASAARSVDGDPPADGFYRAATARNEARTVEAGERLSLVINEAVLVAKDNENATFELSLRVPHDASLASPATLLLVVGGTVYVSSGAGASGTTWSHASFSVRGREAATVIGKFLGIAPRLRRHPGHRLRVAFVPESLKVEAWKPPHVTLRLTNIGDGPVVFEKGTESDSTFNGFRPEDRRCQQDVTRRSGGAHALASQRAAANASGRTEPGLLRTRTPSVRNLAARPRRWPAGQPAMARRTGGRPSRGADWS